MSIQVEGLRKVYKKRFSRKPPLVAVDDLSFQVKPGEIYALLGPNGAGKTTTIKMTAGLISPDSGSILLNGKRMKPGKTHHELSAVLEGTRNVYWRLTPLENLYYFANLRGVRSGNVSQKAPELLKLLEIDAKQKNQSQHLSRGMLQKLALAAALITDPKVLLLDEPSLGLDVESSRKIKEKIRQLAKEEGRSIILTTHQMSLVEELADRVGIIRNGKIVAEGTILELKSVFHSYIYRLKVRKPFTFTDIFHKEYKLSKLQEGPDSIEVELDCRSAEGVLNLMKLLYESEPEVVSLAREVEDLEEIFIRTLSAGREKSR